MRLLLSITILFLAIEVLASSQFSHPLDRYESCWETISVNDRKIESNPKSEYFRSLRWTQSSKFWQGPQGQDLESIEGGFFFGFFEPYNVYEYIGIPLEIGYFYQKDNITEYHYEGPLTEKRTGIQFKIKIYLKVIEYHKNHVEWTYVREYPENSSLNSNNTYILNRCLD